MMCREVDGEGSLVAEPIGLREAYRRTSILGGGGLSGDEGRGEGGD